MRAVCVSGCVHEAGSSTKTIAKPSYSKESMEEIKTCCHEGRRRAIDGLERI